MFKKKRFVVIAVIVAVIVIFILFRMLNSGGGQLLVETSILQKGDIKNTLTVSGPIEGTDSVHITSGLHAKITSINVKEGDNVVAGETVLANIDDSDLKRNVDIAKGNYELAVSQRDERLKNNQVSYQKAKQALDNASSNYDRQNALHATGAVSDAALESAAADLENARRDVSVFQLQDGKVVADDSLEIAISNAKLELDKAESNLSNATLVAPISGTVTRVYAQVGKFADGTENNNATLMTIENLDKLQLKLLVSEYSIGKVELGQSVDISADILGKGNTVHGEVTSISPSGELKNGSGSERVIPVQVSIDSAGTKLISGITARANILLEEKKDAWLIPFSAIGTNAEGQSVMQFIVNGNESGGEVRTLPIETGIEGDFQVELLSNPLEGIDNSEQPRYITTYQPGLTDGMRVNFMPQQ